METYLKRLEKLRVLRTNRGEVLSKLEVSQIIGASTRRCRAIIALQAFSGIRSWVLGTAEGRDGLLLSDFHDSEITSTGLQFSEYPAIFTIRPTLNRQSTQGYACTCEEGLIYINEYLSQRMQDGEALSPTSPLICRRERLTNQVSSWNRFLPTRHIENEICSAFKSERIPWDPLILRNYFKSNLVLARQYNKITDHELHSLLNHSTIIKEFSLQSDPSIPSFRRRMRRAYNACKPYLSTVINSSTSRSLFNESNGWVYV